MTQLEKRIPVSEDIWKELGRIKEAGETYNELLREMIKEHNRLKLMEKMEKAEKMNKKELIPINEL